MEKRVWVGIDWGNRAHTVCALDPDGTVLYEREVAHEGDAVRAFVEDILALADGDAARVCAAMEAPRGTMVEALMDAGVMAYHINPKQLDRFRDRRSVAGAKDDDMDALVLADSLRTDRHLFRPIVVADPDRLMLQSLSRSYGSLTDSVVAMGSQVREQLGRYYPQMSALGRWHEEPWLWELFEAAPTPDAARRLRKDRVKRILSKSRIRRLGAQDVIDRLRQAPLPVAPGVPEAAARAVLALLPLLRAAHAQRQQCESDMKALMTSSVEQVQSDVREREVSDQGHAAHRAMQRDAQLLLSLPGIGVRNGAAILAEAHAALQDRDYSAFRKLAGTAPVSRRTGGRAKHPRVIIRRARNPRLADAVHQWAQSAARHDEPSRQHYQQLRARGHGHARAVRGVADRLGTVLMAVLKHGEPYDQNRRIKPPAPVDKR